MLACLVRANCRRHHGPCVGLWAGEGTWESAVPPKTRVNTRGCAATPLARPASARPPAHPPRRSTSPSPAEPAAPAPRCSPPPRPPPPPRRTEGPRRRRRRRAAAGPAGVRGRNCGAPASGVAAAGGAPDWRFGPRTLRRAWSSALRSSAARSRHSYAHSPWSVSSDCSWSARACFIRARSAETAAAFSASSRPRESAACCRASPTALEPLD